MASEQFKVNLMKTPLILMYLRGESSAQSRRMFGTSHFVTLS